MKKILAFSGSNSSTSINQTLINSVVKMIKNASVEVVSLIDYPAEIYCIDIEMSTGIPKNMVDFRQKMIEADGFLISLPEHNGSMTAVLKSTLDWQSRQGGKIFLEKPVVFLSTSNGPRGGASVLEHVVNIMPHRGAKIVGSHAVGNFDQVVLNGQLVHGEDSKIIEELLAKLAEAL